MGGFEQIVYTLTVTTDGTGTGTVSTSIVGMDCAASCTALLAKETVVTLTGTADSGSTFTGWSGEGCSGTDDCVVTIDAAKYVTATFMADTPDQFTLTVVKDGTGSGSVTSAPAGIDCGASCSAPYAEGTEVTLSGTADSGSTFTGWSGEGCSGTNDCVVTMDTAKDVTATFTADTPGQFTLTVVKDGTGSGSVTSTPAGIDCGASCSAPYADGTEVTLSGTADSGSTFTGWSGEGCSGTDDCVVTMDAAKNVTATFTADTPGQFTLTVVKDGTGSGSVTSTPAGIDCGASCSAPYAEGTVVTLSAHCG